MKNVMFLWKNKPKKEVKTVIFHSFHLFRNEHVFSVITACLTPPEAAPNPPEWRCAADMPVHIFRTWHSLKPFSPPRCPASSSTLSHLHFHRYDTGSRSQSTGEYQPPPGTAYSSGSSYTRSAPSFAAPLPPVQWCAVPPR